MFVEEKLTQLLEIKKLWEKLIFKMQSLIVMIRIEERYLIIQN